MREDIKNLLDLQKLDLIHDDMEYRLKEIPELIKEEDEKCRQSTEKISDAKNELSEINLNIKQKELELEEAEGFIGKQNVQLNTLKSNEAYSKMQVEISAKKNEIGKIEDTILELSYNVEEKQERIKKLMENLHEEKKVIKENQDKYRQEIENIKSNKKEVEDKIKHEAEKIKAGILEIYKKVRVRRNGIALVEINDASCGGCHCQLPPQMVNDVIKGEQIVRCENCNRFLYIDYSKDDI